MAYKKSKWMDFIQGSPLSVAGAPGSSMGAEWSMDIVT